MEYLLLITYKISEFIFKVILKTLKCTVSLFIFLKSSFKLNKECETLSGEQLSVIRTLKETKNDSVVVIGSWGVGKSMVIKRYLKEEYGFTNYLLACFNTVKLHGLTKVVICAMNVALFLPRLILLIFIIPSGRIDASNFFALRRFKIFTSISLSTIITIMLFLIDLIEYGNNSFVWFLFILAPLLLVWMITLFKPVFALKICKLPGQVLWIENLDRTYEKSKAHKLLSICKLYSDAGIKVIVECTELKNETMMHQLEKFTKKYIYASKIIKNTNVNNIVIGKYFNYDITGTNLEIKNLHLINPRILDSFLSNNINHLNKIKEVKYINFELDPIIMYDQIMWKWPNIAWMEDVSLEFFEDKDMINKISLDQIIDLTKHFDEKLLRITMKAMDMKSENNDEFKGIIIESYKRMNKIFDARKNWELLSIHKDIITNETELKDIKTIDELTKDKLIANENLINEPSKLWSYCVNYEDTDNSSWKLSSWIMQVIIKEDDQSLRRVIEWARGTKELKYSELNLQSLEKMFSFISCTMSIIVSQKDKYFQNGVIKECYKGVNVTKNTFKNLEESYAILLDKLCDISKMMWVKAVENGSFSNFTGKQKFYTGKGNRECVIFNWKYVNLFSDGNFNHSLFKDKMMDLYNVRRSLPALFIETLFSTRTRIFNELKTYVIELLKESKYELTIKDYIGENGNLTLSQLSAKKEFREFMITIEDILKLHKKTP